MIKIKKIFFLFLFLLINIEKTNAEISDSLFMTIGNKPITQSDLVDEIKRCYVKLYEFICSK